MNVWLLKTEPKECSLDDIREAPEGIMRWDGVRNYQARNFLRDGLAVGDLCLIYHSMIATPGIVGSARVVRAAYPDPAQFDPESDYHDPRATPAAPRWVCVDVRYAAHFPRPLPLATIRQTPELASMVLLHHGRLSVQPVSAAEWKVIARLCGAGKG